MLSSEYVDQPLTAELRRRALDGPLPRRPLGATGLELAILGMGGFHLIETPDELARDLLHLYLDAGGNYVETAPGYGAGESERKIGLVMRDRRDDCVLATKTHMRDRAGAARSIDESLGRLQTDHVDCLFMHNVSSDADLDRIAGGDGALRAAEDARDAGKVRFIGLTSHCPPVLQRALQAYPFDLMMEWINYLDWLNFPLISEAILPLCRERGIGILAMKPVGDGLLWRSWEQAFRWVWGVERLACAVAGSNTMHMLASDLALAKSAEPMDRQESLEWMMVAPELGRYVCRQCGACMPNDAGLDIPAIFRLEGYFDRQMQPGDLADLGDRDLRDGLCNWFGNRDYARRAYAELHRPVPDDVDCADAEANCPAALPITAKLRLVARKLSQPEPDA